jgi:hypothetical protein
MDDCTAVLDRLERAARDLHEAMQAAIRIARNQAKELQARTADDDEWLRMPGAKQKCPILGCSHGTIRRHIKDKKIRRKRAVGTTFYSGADARRLIRKAPEI